MLHTSFQRNHFSITRVTNHARHIRLLEENSVGNLYLQQSITRIKCGSGISVRYMNQTYYAPALTTA